MRVIAVTSAVLLVAGSLYGQPFVDAPVFGTREYFRTHFGHTLPRVEMKAPARLSEFVVDGHLELSLRAYLELVLANNTQIAIQKLNVEIPKHALTRALAAFDPTFVGTFRSTRTQSPTADVLAGAAAVNQLTQPVSFAYQQTLDTGTTYSIGFTGNKNSTNSAFATVNPSISAALNFQVTQPLLRNRGRFVNRLQYFIAQSRLNISKHDLQTQLMALLAQAENVYWSAIEARENLRVTEEALKLADAFLRRARRELELGAISPLDIYQPEQNRANQEIFLTQARYQYAQALDAIRQQIGADLDPDFRHMPIVLTEPVLPPEREEAIDPEQMVEIAYQRRPDLKAQLENLKIDDFNYEVAKNQLKPDLSLGLTYSSQGLGGIYYRKTNVFGGQAQVVEVIPGGLGDALRQVFGLDYPTYGFSLTLRLPIRDRRAASDLADALVNKKLNSLRVQNLQQQIRLEVLNAVNQLESAKARVKLAQTSLEFSQKRVEAEQKKYDLGVTTIFFVLDAQNALTAAQSQLVTAVAQYRRAWTNLLRVTGQLLEARGVVIQ